MSETESKTLGISYIKPEYLFNEQVFNDVIDDIDKKVVGISHLTYGAHFDIWKPNTKYNKDDIVRTKYVKSNQYLLCTTTGTSDTNPKNEPKVNILDTDITDGTVEWRVKSFGSADSSGTEINVWRAGIEYVRGTVVIYNHKLYRCDVKNKGNTFDEVKDNWQEITASNNIWIPSMYYEIGDTVIHNSMLYICVTANSDSSFMASNWKLVNNYYTIPQYKNGVEYRTGQLVFYNNKILQANSTVNDTKFDSSHWNIVYDSYILPWVANYQYYPNNICIYNDKLYRCIASNNDTTFTPNKWIEISSSAIKDYIMSGHTYDIDDVFKLNGQLYSVNAQFTTNNTDISNFDNYITPLKADIPKWTAYTRYKKGMIVEYQYNLYKCETLHTSTGLFTVEDKTTNTTYWKPLGKLITQLEYYDNTKTYNINDCVLKKEDYGTATWDANTSYSVGDEVNHNGIIYKCITANSDTTFIEKNWEEINTEKILLYRCVKATSSEPSISSSDWELIDSYIDLAKDSDIETLFA